MDNETKEILSKVLDAINFLDCVKMDGLIKNTAIEGDRELAKDARDRLNNIRKDLNDLRAKHGF